MGKHRVLTSSKGDNLNPVLNEGSIILTFFFALGSSFISHPMKTLYFFKKFMKNKSRYFIKFRS
jgi:hypothetical protein